MGEVWVVTLADYAVRLVCTLVAATFVWLIVGVLVATVAQRAVLMPHAGLLALWACAFVGGEVSGFWKGVGGR